MTRLDELACRRSRTGKLRIRESETQKNALRRMP
jgi:hypothetical protein